jgi:hypothetical protein
LSHRIESLEDLWSKLFSHGSFPNTPTRCSVKCLRGDKLFFESILPRLKTRRILPGLETCPFCPILPVGFYQSWKLVRFVQFYQSDFTRAENLSVLSDFTKAENSSDFTRAENWAECVSDFEVWDIGQVTVSNFDWLPFTPLWSPSPVLQLVSEPV